MSQLPPKSATRVWFNTRVQPWASGIRREDLGLAISYFLVFWILNAVSGGGGFNFNFPWLSQNWVFFAAVGCAAVVLRRSATPLMAILCGSAAVMLLLSNQPTALILVFELFFSLVLFGSPKVSAAASKSAVALSVLVTLLVLALTGEAEATVVAAVAAVMTLLMPMEWAGNLRKAQHLTESESARAEAVRASAEHRFLADRTTHELILERERQHMARELHDVLSARLSAIALQSGAALHTGLLQEKWQATKILSQIRSESVAALDELNGMIRLLHTGALDETAGRAADVISLVEQHHLSGTMISYENSLPDGGDHLPLQLQTILYRVCAESLRNAALHAPGTPVTITLACSTGTAAEVGVVLLVSNPLPRCPVPPAQTGSAEVESSHAGTGTGIPSMHFRAAHAGGTISTGLRAGHWVVELRLPIASSASAEALLSSGAAV